MEKYIWIVLLKHRTGYIEAHTLLDESKVSYFVTMPNYIKTIKTTVNKQNKTI
jgi:hypothetical protein